MPGYALVCSIFSRAPRNYLRFFGSPTPAPSVLQSAICDLVQSPHVVRLILRRPSRGQMIATARPPSNSMVCSSFAESSKYCFFRRLFSSISHTVDSQKSLSCPQSHLYDDGYMISAIG